MGNVLTQASESDSALAEARDKEFLQLPSNMIFNDDFVASVFESLPPLEPASELFFEEEKEGEKEERTGARERALLTALRRAGDRAELADFALLDIREAFAGSAFARTSHMRDRLLLRAHMALAKHGAHASLAHGSRALSAKSLIYLLCEASPAANLPANVAANANTSANDVLVAMNVSMCLSIAKSIGPQFPDLCVDLFASLCAVLTQTPPSLLAAPAPPLSRALDQLSALALSLLAPTTSSPAVAQASLGLLFALALSRSNARLLLALARALLQHAHALPASAQPAFKALTRARTDLLLSTPSPTALDERVSLSLEHLKWPSGARPLLAAGALACEGGALFLYCESACSLARVGAGTNGCLAGEVLSHASLLDQLQKWRENGDNNDNDNGVGGKSEAEGVSEGDVSLTIAETIKSASDLVAAAQNLVQLSETGLSSQRIDETLLTQLTETTSQLESAVEELTSSISVKSLLEYGFDPNQLGEGLNLSENFKKLDKTGESSIAYLSKSIGLSSADSLINYVEFEITHEEVDEEDVVSVGFGDPDVYTPTSESLPGQASGSFGFQSDGACEGEGCVVRGWPACKDSGRVIGVGFDSNNSSIFVTLNGELLGTAFTGVQLQPSQLFPLVAFKGDSDFHVTVNIGDSPFRYSGPELNFGSCVGCAAHTAHIAKPIPRPASICFVGGKLFLRSESLLGRSDKLAVFHPKTLKLEAIRNISFTESEEEEKEGGKIEKRHFEFSDADAMVDIAVPLGRELFVVEAVCNGQSVVENVSKLLSEKRFLRSVDILAGLRPPVDPSNHTSTPSILHLSVESRPVSLTTEEENLLSTHPCKGAGLLPGLSTDGKSLVVAGHSQIRSSGSAFFSLSKHLSITSSFFSDANLTGNDCTVVVNDSWKRHLAHLLSPVEKYSSPYVNPDVFAGSSETATTSRTLWINFSLDLQPYTDLVKKQDDEKMKKVISFTVTFAEGSQIDFSVLIQRAELLYSGVISGKLNLYFIDPFPNSENAHQVSRSTSIRPNPSMLFDKLSLARETLFLTNGSKLLIQQIRPGGRRPLSVTLHSFVYSLKFDNNACDSINEDIEENVGSTSSEVFDPRQFAPGAVSFDANRNFIWMWDRVGNRLAKWRNAGLRDRSPTASNLKDEWRLVDINPDNRLQSLLDLEKVDKETCKELNKSKREAAIIVSVMDRLSTPYGPGGSVDIDDEDEPAGEIELISKCKDSSSPGFCCVTVRGQRVGTGHLADFETGAGRGYNIVVLDSNNFSLLPGHCRFFDTFGDPKAADAMAEFLEFLPASTIVLITTNYTASHGMTARAFASLRNLGANTARLEKNTATTSPFFSFCMVGIKNAKPNSALQRLAPASTGRIVLRQTLPATRVSLCLDPTCSQSLSDLVNLCKELFVSITKSFLVSTIESSPSELYDASVLLGLFRVLSANLFQLQKGTSHSRALQLFSANDRKVLRDLLLQLVDQSSDVKLPSILAGLQQAGLDLFVSCIDLLYASSEERLTLLQHYLSLHSLGKLQPQEAYVLQLMLKKAAAPKALALLTSSSSSGSNASSSSGVQLLHTLLGIAKDELPKRLTALSSSSMDATLSSSSLADAATVLISHLARSLLSQVCIDWSNYLESPDSKGSSVAVKEKGSQLATSLVSTIIAMLDASLFYLTSAKEMLQSVKENGFDEKEIGSEVDDILQSSVVGSLLPIYLHSAGLLLTSHGSRLLAFAGTKLFDRLGLSLEHLTESLSFFLNRLSLADLVPVKTVRTKTQEKVIESCHPYLDNQDTSEEIHFPGATRLSISFDPQSRTENGCDYIRILDSSQNLLHASLGNLSGRDGSQNWPGCEGRPSLEIAGDRIFVAFHSDGSVNDWGYKMTITAELTVSHSRPIHWLAGLSRGLVNTKTIYASTYVTAEPWQPLLEDPHEVFLTDSFLPAELFAGHLGTKEEDLLLTQLPDRPEGSLSSTLASLMRSLVREDQGSIECVNRAVYATCAALIKENGLVKEALAFAKGSRPDASPALIKAWAAGQKMRAYFSLADLRQSVSQESSTQVGASIYSGSDSDTLKAAAEAVVSRALFLCRVPKEDSSDGAKEGDLGRPPRGSSFMAKQRWGMLKTDGTLRVLGRQDSSGDNNRVSSFTRQDSFGMERQLSRARSNSEVSFGQVIGEAQVSDKVRNLLLHRRRIAERKETTRSLTERVLGFVQSSSLDMNQLQKASELRTLRATQRAKGISYLVQSLSLTSSPFCLSWTLYSLAYLMRYKLVHAESVSHAKVHYSVGVEGSSPEIMHMLSDSFAQLTRRCVQILNHAYQVITGKNDKESEKSIEVYEVEKSQWIEAALACLRVLAMDYQATDHSTLDKAGLLSVLQLFMSLPVSSSSSASPSAAASALFELIVDRCVVVESLDEQSSFSLKLANALVERLQSVSDVVQSVSEALPLIDSSGLPGKSLLREAVVLTESSAGFSHPSVPLTLDHSVSLYVYRSRSSIDAPDLLEASGDLKLGQRVIRGVDWSGEQEDGGLGCLGSVSSIEGDACKVSWDNGKKGEYKFSLTKREICPASDGLSGQIYVKGCPALSDADFRRRKPAWSSFGLSLLPDASVCFFVADGKCGHALLRSSSVIPPEQWTHVTTTSSKDSGLISLHISSDSLSTTSTLPLQHYLLSPGEGMSVQTIESPHPYSDNSDLYETVSFPGASRLTVTFDPQTCTETNYDYIKFYKSNAHDETWGEQYSGGRGGSSRNFPGVDGNPPLIIPADSCVVYFKSDGSNNDWGYKITIEADMSAVAKPASADVQLNSFPFYLGQQPFQCGSGMCFDSKGFTGLIADVKVFNSTLNDKEIKQLQEQKPKPVKGLFDEASCISAMSQLLQGLNLYQKRGETLPTEALSKTFSSQTVLKALLSIASKGRPVLQHAAFKAISLVVPRMVPEAVDFIASSVNFASTSPDSKSFIASLFRLVGETVLGTVSGPKISIASTAKDREDFEASLAISHEQVQLLRVLASAGQEWEVAVSEETTRICKEVSQTLTQLSICCSQEMEPASNLSFVQPSQPSQQQLQSIAGLFSFLGGWMSGLYPGAQAMYHSPSGLAELCTIICPTRPPTFDAKKDKEALAVWGTDPSFGDALVIVLQSNQGKPLVVSRESLSLSGVSDKSLASLQSFFSHAADSDLLVEALRLAISLPLLDTRPILQAAELTKDHEKVLQSQHPYLDGQDEYSEISFPGAEQLVITFDPRSRCEHGCDYVRFYKDAKRVDYWGENEYSGRDGTQNFPGCEGRAPLVIPASSCTVYFHSDASGNDWGYYLTIKATTRQVTEPPSATPLTHLPLQRLISMLANRAVASSLAELDWLYTSSRASLIAPALLQTSLLAPPRSLAGSSSRSLVFESSHPYENDLQTYIPVRIPGAKKLSVTFDPQSATESGPDFGRDSSHTVIIPGADCYTGGKDGGSSNWPGMQGRPPLVVAGDSFVIYFQTDGSVNAWGWKMTVVAEGPTPTEQGDQRDSDGIEESVEPLNMSPDTAAQSLLYLATLHKDGPVLPLHSTPSLGFKTLLPATYCKGFISDFNDDFNEDVSINVGLSSKSDIGVVSDGSLPIEKSSRSVYRVNPVISDEWPKGFVLASELSVVLVHQLPDDASDVASQLERPGIQFLASQQQGDWLYGSPAGDISTPEQRLIVGWVRRRLGDADYMLPDNTVEGCKPVIVNVPDTPLDLALVTASGQQNLTSAPRKHPMYEIDERGSDEETHDSTVKALPLLRQWKDELQKGAGDFALAATIGYARQAANTMLSRWKDRCVEPLTLEAVGGLSLLLSFTNTAVSNSSGWGNEKANGTSLTSLKSLLLSSLKSDQSASLSKNLLSFAKRQFKSQTLTTSTPLPLPPQSRAAVIYVESEHPYANDEDRDWPIRIPGARRLRLEFDPRSSSELNCDYVTIRSADGTDLYKKKITGPATDSSKHWPGVNCPPAEIEGDCCCLNFKSDAATNDWGFKVRVLGILEEPSEEARVEYKRRMQKEKKKRESGGEPSLGCWLLSLLAEAKNSDLDNLLYTPDTFASLKDYFAPPGASAAVLASEAEKRIGCARLLCSLLTSGTRAGLLSRPSVLEQILQIRSQVLTSATSLYKNDTEGGQKPQMASRLLQTCAHLVIVLDDLLSTIDPLALLTLTNSSSSNISSSRLSWKSLEGVDLDSDCLVAESKVVSEAGLTLMGSFSVSTGVHSWNFLLSSLSIELLILDAQNSSSAISWSCGKLNFGNISVDLWSSFTVGDIISVRLDISCGCLYLFRNGCSALAIGPVNSGAIIEADLGKGPFTPAVRFLTADLSAQILDYPLTPSINNAASVASTSASTSLYVPEWLKPLKESVSVLRACQNRDLSASILAKHFLPTCMQKASMARSIDLLVNKSGKAEDFEGISFDGAQSVVCILSGASLLEGEHLRFYNNKGELVDEVVGERKWDEKPADFVNASLLAQCVTSPSPQNSSENQDLSERVELTVGDLVSRGVAWTYGDQDGGCGSVGVVTSIGDWRGKAGTAISVKWSGNQHSGVYRWGFDGLDDICVVKAQARKPLSKTVENKTVNALGGFAQNLNNTFIIYGNSCKVVFESNLNETSDNVESRVLQLNLVPRYSLSGALAQTEFEPYLRYLRAQFLGSTEAGQAADFSLVRLIDTVANNKNLNGTTVLSVKFEDCRPSADDTTRSPPLKHLVESVTPELPAGFEVKVSALPDPNDSIQTEGDFLPVLCECGEPMSLRDAQLFSLDEDTGGWICDCDEHENAPKEKKKEEKRFKIPRGLSLSEKGSVSGSGSESESESENESGGDESGSDEEEEEEEEEEVHPYSECAYGCPTMVNCNYCFCRKCFLRASQPDLFKKPQCSCGDELSPRNANDYNRMIDEEDESVDSDADDRHIVSWNCDCPQHEGFSDMHMDDVLYGCADFIDCDFGFCQPCFTRESQKVETLSKDSLARVGEALVGVSLPEIFGEGRDVGDGFSSLEEAAVYACAYAKRGVTGVSYKDSSRGYRFFLMTGTDLTPCEDVGALSYLVKAEELKRTTDEKTITEESTVSVASVPQVAVLQPIEARFNTLIQLNKALSKALSLFDLDSSGSEDLSHSSLSSLVSACRGLILERVKRPVWEDALAATKGQGGEFDLKLSRSRARKHAATNKPDHDARYAVFSQAFRQMHSLPASQLRRDDKLYNCQFMGERSQDAGGPYRESFAIYAQELQSSALPLLLLTPNGRHATGLNREKWVFHPGSTSHTHLQMYEFLGKLMGIAIRSKDYLALNLPSFIWKLIAGDEPTLEDLEEIDFSLVRSIQDLRYIDRDNSGHPGIKDDEAFAQIFFETFTITTTDDRTVELVPGGSNRDLTFTNRAEYCDLVTHYRLHEFDIQAAAVKRGLGTIVPIALLNLFTWSQVEQMVCGKAEIDVKLLESITEYSGCSSQDAHVRLFWQALREFSNDERSALVRFTWGRSRLPLTSSGFTQRFKIQNFGHSPADTYFPVAHTCFFSLELPAYSSLAIMKEKLRYAIFNCEAIDGDDTETGMAVAAMGWEE